MPDNWLQARLSPVKKDTARWQELAQAIETFWQENFDADAARLDGLKSIFTATRADQLAILSELGKYYDIDLPDDSIPLAIIQRRMELFQKDTLVPLTESLKRACPGIRTEWRPLYARHDRDYSDGEFYTEAELIRDGHEDWLLFPNRVDGSWVVVNPANIVLLPYAYTTSRGKILIDETNIENPESIETTIRSRIALVKPLNIVFDGLIWVITFSVVTTWGDITDHNLIASWFYVGPIVECDIVVMDPGMFNLDGTHFVCGANGRYRVPVVALMSRNCRDYIGPFIECDIVVTDPGMFNLDGTHFVCGANGRYRVPVVASSILSWSSALEFVTELAVSSSFSISMSSSVTSPIEFLVNSTITSFPNIPVSDNMIWPIEVFAFHLDGSLEIDGTWEI